MFYHCISLTEITIPYGVTTIRDGAFDSCESLTSVTIPDSVFWIDSTAFAECSDALTLFVRPNSYALQYADAHGILCELDTSPAAIVDSGSCGKDVTWTLDADGVLTISGTGPMTDYTWGNSPFYENEQILHAIIEQGVTYVGAYTFLRCRNLVDLAISGDMINYDYSAFDQCDNLSSITVAENNPSYRDIDGVLFTKDGAHLLKYPAKKAGSAYSVPNGVTHIDRYAFYRASYLNSITLPSSLTHIGNYAFSECNSLTEVFIPAHVETIDTCAWGGCERLTAFQVADDNAFYCAVDGVVFNKNKTTLVQYPSGRTATVYQIPSGVAIIGEEAFHGALYLKTVHIPASVFTIQFSGFGNCFALQEVEIAEGLTIIGFAAFQNCYDLAAIRIPLSVKTIDYCVFMNCSALTLYGYEGTVAQSYANDNSIHFVSLGNPPEMPDEEAYIVSDGVITGYVGYMTDLILPTEINGTPVTGIGVDAFRKSVVTNVTIPEGYLTIDDYAFEGCEKLTRLQIPSTVTSISTNGFDSCYSLTGIDVADGNKHYCDIDGVLFDKNVSTLLLYPRGKSESAYLVPSSVTCIGDYAFYSSALTSITLPDHLTRIETYAFNNCYNLSEIVIPDQVAYIGSQAFTRCAFSSVSLPASVTQIEEGAFSMCSNLTSILVSAENPAYRSIDGVLFSKDKAALVQYPNGKANASYQIPDSVTQIKGYAFTDNQALKAIDIPNSVCEIGDCAFESTGLLQVTVPNTVSRIGRFTFGNCKNLSSVVIGENVSFIGPYAFVGCRSLASITIPASVTTIEEDALLDCPRLTIYGYLGTTAQAYAQENGIPFEPLGCAHVWGPADVIQSPTETEEGTAAHMCTVCGMMKTFQIPALSNMRVLRLPASLTSIEAEAFAGLNIQAVLIPDGCVSVGSKAFADCPSLLYVRAPMGTVFAAQSFDGCSDNLVIERIAP